MPVAPNNHSAGAEILNRLLQFQQPNESDRAFSKRIGVGAPSFQDWKLRRDAGRRFEPRISTVRKLAAALGVSWVWLLTGMGAPGLKGEEQ